MPVVVVPATSERVWAFAKLVPWSQNWVLSALLKGWNSIT